MSKAVDWKLKTDGGDFGPFKHVVQVNLFRLEDKILMTDHHLSVSLFRLENKTLSQIEQTQASALVKGRRSIPHHFFVAVFHCQNLMEKDILIPKNDR